MNELHLPWPPSANRYWKKYCNRMCLSQAAVNYKNAVGHLCKVKKVPLLTGRLYLEVELYPPSRHHRDGHNFTKVLLDALEGFLYDNDAQVTKLLTTYHIDEIKPDGLTVVKY